MNEPREIDTPIPGYWLVTQTRGGPWLPACIFLRNHEPDAPDNLLDRAPHFVGAIAGIEVDPLDVWTRRGRTIDRNQYEGELKRLRWLQTNQPDHPLCHPTERVDVSRLPLPVFPRDSDL